MNNAKVYVAAIDTVSLLLAGLFYIVWDGERLDNGVVRPQQFMFVLLMASSAGFVFRLAHHHLPATVAWLFARGLLVAAGGLLYTGSLTACFVLFGMAGVIGLLWRGRLSEEGSMWLLYLFFFFISMSVYIGGLRSWVQVRINELYGMMLIMLAILEPFIQWLRSPSSEEERRLPSQ